jgi:hypothetical protein
VDKRGNLALQVTINEYFFPVAKPSFHLWRFQRFRTRVGDSSFATGLAEFARGLRTSRTRKRQTSNESKLLLTNLSCD